jgi:hypothetical protein
MGFDEYDPLRKGWLSGFTQRLGESGYVEGQNVTVEYHGLEVQYDRRPALMAAAVVWTSSPRPAALQLRLPPKRRQRRSRLSSHLMREYELVHDVPDLKDDVKYVFGRGLLEPTLHCLQA